MLRGGMIESFTCAETEKLFHGRMSRRLPTDIQRTARRKLLQLNAATQLQDMAVPPGNRLEALKGGRAVAMMVLGDIAYSTGQVIMVDGGQTVQRL